MEHVSLDSTERTSPLALKEMTLLVDGAKGSIEPSVQLGSYLIQRGWQLNFIGSGHAKENALLSQVGMGPESLFRVSTPKTIGKGWGSMTQRIYIPFKRFMYFFQALYFFGKTRPQVVLALEGKATFWGGLAAWIRGIPVVLLATDRTLGTSQRLLRPFCKAVLASFAGTDCEETLVGLPISSGFLTLSPPAERFKDRHGPLRVLALGTQLPKAVNEAITQLSALAPGRLEIVHELTSADQRRYQALDGSIGYRCAPPTLSRSQMFAWADCVIAGAGAVTVAKLGAAGLGGILVPLHSCEHKQHQNVAHLVERGAIFLLKPSQWDAVSLLEQLMLNSRQGWFKKACSAYHPLTKSAETRIDEALTIYTL